MPARLVAAILLALALAPGAWGQSHSVRQLAPGVYVWQGDRDNREPANCAWEGGRFTPASITFEQHMAFDDGAQRMELGPPRPVHIGGDIVADLPRQKILATGDLCVTWDFGNNVADPAADYDHWLAALDQMIAWEPAVVVPGHGAPGTVEALRNERGYLADMLTQVRAGIGAGKSADDLARSIDLRSHGAIARDADANAASIRAMYRHLKR